MTALTLAIALALAPLAQSPPADLDFVAAVESSIHRFGTVKSYSRVMTPRHARLVRDLGCPRYSCRVTASECLAADGDRAFRAILWASWSADPEIATRAEGLARPFFACDHCRGTATCPNPYRYSCHACQPLAAAWWIDGDYHGCLACARTGDRRRKPAP